MELLPIEKLKEMAKTRVPIYKSGPGRPSKFDNKLRHEITHKYIVDRKSIYELADEYKCSKSVIHRIVKKTLSE